MRSPSCALGKSMQEFQCHVLVCRSYYTKLQQCSFNERQPNWRNKWGIEILPTRAPPLKEKCWVMGISQCVQHPHGRLSGPWANRAQGKTLGHLGKSTISHEENGSNQVSLILKRDGAASTRSTWANTRKLTQERSKHKGGANNADLIGRTNFPSWATFLSFV